MHTNSLNILKTKRTDRNSLIKNYKTRDIKNTNQRIINETFLKTYSLMHTCVQYIEQYCTHNKMTIINQKISWNENISYSRFSVETCC